MKNTKANSNQRTWYCVTQSYGNTGRIVATITATVQASRKPKSTFASTRSADIYNDWFGTRAAAERFAAKAKVA